jgi:molybdopterin-containing oxidoreductase family membrane subunit
VGFVLPALMLSLPLLIKAAAPVKVSFASRLRPAVAVAIGLALIAGGLVSAIQPTAVNTIVSTAQGAAAIRASASTQSADSVGYVQWVLLLTIPVLFMVLLPEMRAHPVATTTVAAALVTVAMWLKRYLIVVPTLENPYIPIPLNTPSEWAHYTPSGAEWAITAAAFALFILLYVLFAKVFPIVSIWEIHEGREKSVEEVSARVESYLPAPAGVAHE